MQLISLRQLGFNDKQRHTLVLAIFLFVLPFFTFRWAPKVVPTVIEYLVGLLGSLGCHLTVSNMPPFWYFPNLILHIFL